MEKERFSDISKITEARRTQAEVLVKACQDPEQQEVKQAQQCANHGQRETQCIVLNIYTFVISQKPCYIVILKCIHVLGHMSERVDVMTTPKAWATLWPKTMNEVITMQTHWPLCGQ